MPRARSVGVGAGEAPIACVLGDMDLVSPLALAGVRSVVVSGEKDPTRCSRHVRETIPALDHWQEPESLVHRLISWADAQPSRPVLFYQADGDLLLVSRYRDRLSAAFSFVLADRELVEDLVDKARFQRLAGELQLPVPPAFVLRSTEPLSVPSTTSFPVVVKPLSRRMLRPMQLPGKAREVRTMDELREVAAACRAVGADVLVQALVRGPESAIESYHAYIRADGTIAAEFTGVKIRTLPLAFGHSTSVRVDTRPDVAQVGRALVRRIGVTGVAKLDFKRDDDGRLWLLEVNPRFSLWHHPGALAGVNIPALVYSDLVGTACPVPTEPHGAATWCHLVDDWRAASASGLSLRSWLRTAIAADAHYPVGPSDRLPLLTAVRSTAVEVGSRRARRVVGRRRAAP